MAEKFFLSARGLLLAECRWRVFDLSRQVGPAAKPAWLRSFPAECSKTLAMFMVGVLHAAIVSGQEPSAGSSSGVKPPPEIQKIHSEAAVARDKGELELVEKLRQQRLRDAADLPSSSAWKQAVDAINEADANIRGMQYRRASEILLRAWEPFEAHHAERPSAVVFGDLVLKLFETEQAARHVYEENDPNFPRLADTPAAAKERLKTLVDLACTSDPCQVELFAVRAFLTPPDQNERFLTQSNRNSITVRNRDLIKIYRSSGPIKPWHGPAQLFLAGSSSFVMDDLRFLSFLDSATRIRGTDRTGESFHLVLGGGVLCFGTDQKTDEPQGKAVVRHFIDNYADGRWQRLRPYLLEVKKLGDHESSETGWTLNEQAVQERVIALRRTMEQEDEGEAGPANPLAAALTGEDVKRQLRPVFRDFKGLQRRQVIQVTNAILDGQWSQPNDNGLPPPGPRSSLFERLVFLEDTFRVFAQSTPAVRQPATKAADLVRDLKDRLPRPPEPAGVAGMGEAPGDGEVALGDDLGRPIEVTAAVAQLRKCNELLASWKDEFNRGGDSKNAAGLQDRVKALLDYKLCLVGRGIEWSIMRLREMDQDQGQLDSERMDWEGVLNQVFQDYKPVANPTGQVPRVEQPKIFLTLTEGLLGRPTKEAKEPRDVLEVLRDRLPVTIPIGASSQDVDFLLKEAGALVRDRGAELDQAAQIEREIKAVNSGLKLLKTWPGEGGKTQWSIYELTPSAPAAALADLLDSQIVPLLGLREESLVEFLSEEGRTERAELPVLPELTFSRGSPLVRDPSEPAIDLATNSSAFACILCEHKVDQAEDSFRNNILNAQTPEPHRMVRDEGLLKSEFPGCDGFTELGIGRGRRFIVDRRGNTVSARAPSDTKPFRVVNNQTKVDISEDDTRGNVVYAWQDWIDLDQNILNAFMAETMFLSPTLPVWLRYRQEFFRPPPREDFQWGAARSAYWLGEE